MNESTGSRVEFKAPADFRPPENIEADKDFDLVCSFRVKPSGELCLTKLGDVDMPGYGKNEGHEGPEHKPDYSEYTQSIRDAAPSPQQGQSQGY